MSPTVRVVASLVVGLAVGAAVRASGSDAWIAGAQLIEPIGRMWINAILMTVVPLVVSSLVVGVAAVGDPRQVGRLGRDAGLLFLVVVSGGALVTALITPALLDWMPLTGATRAMPAAATGGGVAAAPSIAEWIVTVVPTNPIRAAADGTMLPLLVFTLAFALALTRIEAGLRAPVVRAFAAVAAAMRVLVAWVLVLAPIGVFALSVPLAARLGGAAAGALAYYAALLGGICLAFVPLFYVLAAVGGRVPLRRFARAAAPAQAVAIGSRSSLAALPAMMSGAERGLGITPAVAGFSLPLAVAAFKMSAPVTTIVGTLFLCRLYGVPLDAGQIAYVSGLAVLLSFAVPGVPAGALLVAAPLFASLGLPPQAVGLLIAVDTLPDMFRTLLNVTADLAVTAVLGRPGSEGGGALDV